MRILVSGSTRTVRDAAARWPHHLGHLLTPANRNSVASVVATGLPWGVDNGAFSGFDPDAFRRLLGRARGSPRLLWIVCPDVVGNAHATIALYREWRDEVSQAGPVAFVLQDGQENEELPPADAYFIGGSTRWKLSRAAADLGAEAKRRGAWLHMGRVNTLRRLQAAHDLGCDSVDGSIYSRMSDKFLVWALRWVANLEQQPTLFS